MPRRTKTFNDVLAKIRDDATNPGDLGTKFERIVLSFLKEDSWYKKRFSNVWTYAEWARLNNIKHTHGTSHDIGIDLVATEHTGELCAIQCKCHDDQTILGMEPVNSFISAGTTFNMKTYLLACTGPINDNANAKLIGVKCTVLSKEHFTNSSIDWSAYPRVIPKKPKKLHGYQDTAMNDVINGFKKSDRGKLIMACGTGKTLVSLRVAERLAGIGATVLYLVPSISLILQSMREWSDNAKIPHRYVAVCSDKSVRNEEGGTLTELEAPASTDTSTLVDRLSNLGNDTMNVIFSTYNSIDIVRKAMVGNKIDLVLCDEAHRTASIKQRDFESFFTVIHHNSKIAATRRLYMTATPRVFSENIIKKAVTKEMEIVSMDDPKIFGPVFHELSFYDAVHRYGVLSDFKVIVTVVHGRVIDNLAQQHLTGDDNMVPLGEKSLLSSVWNAIRDPNGDGRNQMLQRVIVFCDIINSSKIFAGQPIRYGEDVEEIETKKEIDKQRAFGNLVNYIKKITADGTDDRVDVRHLDGKDNARYRRRQLEWLKESSDDESVCRMLSNARCLSEGIDVPALDGVVFLNPRKSVIDVVQAVGRVMRKSAGKDYGYVILPVGIPAGMEPDDALKDNKFYKVVWQVLSALRSHDPRLKNEINQMSLEPPNTGDNATTGRIIIRHAYGHDLEYYKPIEEKIIGGIRSKMLKHVGDASYYDKYGIQLGQHAASIETRLKARMKNPQVEKRVHDLRDGLRHIINDSIDTEATIRVLSQHLVMLRVFDALFQGAFATQNPISSVLDAAVKNLKFKDELHDLEDFYKQVEADLSEIKTREARQNFIKKIYDNFFKAAAKKETEQLGIVYTPVEVIDFILNSVQDVLKDEFGTDFADRDVKILDPFTGTGTFISRLLESGMLGDNIYEKYKHDLYANEMILLAYYVAAVNIETTYSSLRRGNTYVPFEGIIYTDTLRLNPRWRLGSHYRHEDSKLDEVFKEAHARIRNQRDSDLYIIVGNPPYSAGQSNFNDQNKNIDYPDIDDRIKTTYSRSTKSINPDIGHVGSLYDSYVRSIRWASDRIEDSGVIGFVTNASFIRSDAAAGIRACLKEEFTDVWIFDLRGNQRTQGEVSKKEGGKIFGSGSRAPVAITILVKNPKKKEHSIHYYDIGDYHSREKKLGFIRKFVSIKGIADWQKIKPDRHHDWLDQRSAEFKRYLSIGNKAAKTGKDNSIFRMYSLGVSTGRGVWVYNSSEKELSSNMKLHIDYCNVQDWNNPVFDPKKAKWDEELPDKLMRFGKQRFDKNKIRTTLYRPFFKQNMYFDKIFNTRQYQIPKFFPQGNSKNLIICVPDKGIGEKFSVLMTDVTPDLHIIAQSQCFSLYVYKDNTRHENIPNFTLQEYRNHYRDVKIVKTDIFYYVYGLLHHNGYKEKYANNLRRELPHIPMAPDFWAFSKTGKKLADLHLSWETCKRYNLGKPKNEFGKYTKMAFARKKKDDKQITDTATLKINGITIFDNIPDIQYRINGRTPLEWAIDRYKVTTDKDSGIINDSTNVDIISLIERLVYIGVQSDKLVSQLLDEFEPRDWKPKKIGLDGFT